MAKGSGSTRLTKDVNYHGKIANIESLKKIKDRQLYNEIGSAISRYHSVLGVRQQNVKLADLSGGVMGVHVTSDGNSQAVYLSKDYFKNENVRSVSNTMRDMYDNGWQTRTNKPVAHVITHELAHATWNNHLSSQNAIQAGKEIRSLYKDWSKDTIKKGYGRYANTNVNEFFAEVTTKAVHGTADRYTNAIKSIIKKYGL